MKTTIMEILFKLYHPMKSYVAFFMDRIVIWSADVRNACPNDHNTRYKRENSESFFY